MKTNRIAMLVRDIAEAANEHASRKPHDAVEKLLVSQLREIVDAWCDMLLNREAEHKHHLRSTLVRWKRTHDRLVEDTYLNKPRRRPFTIA